MEKSISLSSYQQRPATFQDAALIAPLWKGFLEERSHQDPSISLKNHFDYVAYVEQKLQSPSVYGFLLEYGENQEIVGFLFVYVHDETPALDFEDSINSPFNPRRMGGVIGMYVKEKHRHVEGIRLLVDEAITLAEKLKISDIDLLISVEQTGIHKLLERFGFKRVAVEYTKHYEVTDQVLPSLKNESSQGISLKTSQPQLIPLRDPQTKQPVINPNGEQVFLHPLIDNEGKVLHASNGFPIYPTPLRDPQTQDWIFDQSGKLVVCPISLDEIGRVKEKNGMPSFKKPIYEKVDGILKLKQDNFGNYLFE
ncbi:MAG: N-acetyltransferase family protein [Crocosphaera sp.]